MGSGSPIGNWDLPGITRGANTGENTPVAPIENITNGTPGTGWTGLQNAATGVVIVGGAMVGADALAGGGTFAAADTAALTAEDYAATEGAAAANAAADSSVASNFALLDSGTDTVGIQLADSGVGFDTAGDAFWASDSTDLYAADTFDYTTDLGYDSSWTDAAVNDSHPFLEGLKTTGAVVATAGGIKALLNPQQAAQAAHPNVITVGNTTPTQNPSTGSIAPNAPIIVPGYNSPGSGSGSNPINAETATAAALAIGGLFLLMRK